MSTFSIKIDNAETRQEMTVLDRGLSDLTMPFTEAGEKLTKEFFGNKVFESQGGAVQERWKGWASSTARARARRYGHYANSPVSTSKILVWTGAMKEGFVDKPSKRQLQITNNVFYFKYNQPKRTMLKIVPEVEEIVVDAIDKYVKFLIP